MMLRLGSTYEGLKRQVPGQQFINPLVGLGSTYEGLKPGLADGPQ